MSNWKCWRRAWSWRSFIVFLVFFCVRFLLSAECVWMWFLNWIEGKSGQKKCAVSRTSNNTFVNKTPNKSPGKLSEYFINILSSSSSTFPWSLAGTFLSLPQSARFFTAIFLCASFSKLLPRLVMFYFLTVGCVEKSFTFSVIHSVGTLLVEMTNAVVCLFNKKM